MSEYKSAFVVIPHRIMYMEGMQLSYLKVYEVFFQFWNHGKTCYLSNPVISERTGLANSTIREALAFFEKNGEMRRVIKGRKRYLLPPIQAIEVESVDNSASNSAINDHPAEIAAPTRCQVGGLPAAKSAHNNNNINNNNLNKSFCSSIQAEKPKTVDNYNPWRDTNAEKHDWNKSKNEPKQTAKFWEPGNPDYDRVNGTTS